MSLINFPSSPYVGQVYINGSNSWIWNGNAWKTYNAYIISGNGIQGPTGPTGATGSTGPTEDIIACYVDASPDIASTGLKASRVIGYNCEVDEWYVIAGSSGTMQWDVKKSSFASYPSTSSIVFGADYPQISSQSKNSNTSVSSWTSLNAGDVIEFYITSNTDVESVGVFLKIRRV